MINHGDAPARVVHLPGVYQWIAILNKYENVREINASGKEFSSPNSSVSSIMPPEGL